MSEKPKGPYILWLDYGCEGWKPYDFPDIKSALEAERYNNGFVITKLSTFDIKETNND